MTTYAEIYQAIYYGSKPPDEKFNQEVKNKINNFIVQNKLQKQAEEFNTLFVKKMNVEYGNIDLSGYSGWAAAQKAQLKQNLNLYIDGILPQIADEVKYSVGTADVDVDKIQAKTDEKSWTYAGWGKVLRYLMARATKQLEEAKDSLDYAKNTGNKAYITKSNALVGTKTAYVNAVSNLGKEYNALLQKHLAGGGKGSDRLPDSLLLSLYQSKGGAGGVGGVGGKGGRGERGGRGGRGGGEGTPGTRGVSDVDAVHERYPFSNPDDRRRLHIKKLLDVFEVSGYPDTLEARGAPHSLDILHITSRKPENMARELAASGVDVGAYTHDLLDALRKIWDSYVLRCEDNGVRPDVQQEKAYIGIAGAVAALANATPDTRPKTPATRKPPTGTTTPTEDTGKVRDAKDWYDSVASGQIDKSLKSWDFTKVQNGSWIRRGRGNSYQIIVAPNGSVWKYIQVKDPSKLRPSDQQGLTSFYDKQEKREVWLKPVFVGNFYDVFTDKGPKEDLLQ